MELRAKQNVAISLVAAVALVGCGNSPGKPKPAVESPTGTIATVPDTAEQSAPPSEAPDDGTGKTGDYAESTAVRDPQIFVLGRNAGRLVLFGCRRPDDTTLITLGQDYVEDHITGRLRVIAGASPQPETSMTVTELQRDASGHADELISGPQTVSVGDTNTQMLINCGRTVDAASVTFWDESGTTVPASELPAYQPVAGQVDSQTDFVVLPGHA